jgi:type IV pilus assembly protein PilC
VYQYSVYTIDKRVVQGTINATSERTAEEALYRAGYHRILKLREISPGFNFRQWLPSLFGVKSQDVIDFSRQLAVLIESRIPIMTALRLLEEQAPSAPLRKVIAGLAQELQGGSPFPQALARYPQVFSGTYCQVIQSSELSGNFDMALRQAADYLEKETVAVKKIRRALLYPVTVLLMAVAVTVMLATVVLPSLARLFTVLGGELPWTTRSVMAVGLFFSRDKFYILGGLAVLVLLIFSYIKLPSGKMTMDRLALKIPIISNITIQRNLVRFCQTTSILLKAGLPLPQIINVVAGTVENTVFSQALQEVRRKLVQGQSLSQSMATIDLFPQFLVEMIVLGETTGTLDTTLATMADLYTQRVEQRVQTLISMLEPVLITMVGLVVAFIAVSMITPLYSMLKNIH